ncbi:MAG: glycoside hydrolase family 127 protein [Eubacteriales bacterium]|nr:glycoside hydrolase family 127 protein [Eubacteriales bacterium]MDD4476507.1 glycoside hydrolase family 127 protein [Eubacteriales bacterium]
MKRPLYGFYKAKQLKPRGWLYDQLKIQSASLTGNLDKVWPDVKDSKYIGGDREGWERVPYWLDGFIPLAYLLDDEDMKTRAKKYIDAIIVNQKEDGWICPCSDEQRPQYDMWALLLLAKVLMLYYDCSGDERIPEVLLNALENLLQHIKKYPLFGWGKARWFEAYEPICRLYDKTKADWLLELAELLYSQGEKYSQIIKTDKFKYPKREWTFETHVVNMAQALKCGSVSSLFECVGEEDSEKLYSELMKYHGTPAGHFNGDECLSGKSPIQGAELCSIVEAMFSHEVNFSLSGEAKWLDRLEMLAFNSLPSTVSPDMWSHQYDQMINQISCSAQNEPAIFMTNSRDANIFGLEPNYGCCTANYGQGWPKLTLSSFFEGEQEIVSAVPIPSELSTDISSVPVKVTLDTEYPFREKLSYKIQAERKVDFALKIRVPDWVEVAQVDGVQYSKQNGFLIIDRTWDENTEFTVTLYFKTAFVDNNNGMFSLKYGALLFTPDIKEKWIMHEYTKDGVDRFFPYCDYEIHPESKWNYAFTSKDVKVVNSEITAVPFSHTNPPVRLEVQLSELNWDNEPGQSGVCAATPNSRAAIGKPEAHLMKPYGCSALHMASLPFAE